MNYNLADLYLYRSNLHFKHWVAKHTGYFKGTVSSGIVKSNVADPDPDP